MFNVDMRDFLNQECTHESICIRTRNPDETDEYGNQKPLSYDVKWIKGVITEKLENGYDTNTGTFLERIVYKIYVDKKYYPLDLIGAELLFRNKVTVAVSNPLLRPYASHFIINATERKVNMNDRS